VLRRRDSKLPSYDFERKTYVNGGPDGPFNNELEGDQISVVLNTNLCHSRWHAPPKREDFQSVLVPTYLRLTLKDPSMSNFQGMVKGEQVLNLHQICYAYHLAKTEIIGRVRVEKHHALTVKLHSHLPTQNELNIPPKTSSTPTSSPETEPIARAA
jgi:hypothetical protein